MDSLLDRVSAVNPATAEEFTGRTNFEALTPPKRRRRWVLVPALGAALAAVVVLPNSAPQAGEVLLRTTEAVAVDDGGILYARSTYTINGHSGTREIWVLGDTAMRWKGDNGADEVYVKGEGTTRRSPAGEIVRDPASRMVPTEIFRIPALLERARDVGLEEETIGGRRAYALRWNEPPGRRTLWVDAETYLPLRLIDESPQSTFVEDIVEFETLPDTPENRRLLTLQ